MHDKHNKNSSAWSGVNRPGFLNRVLVDAENDRFREVLLRTNAH